MVATETRRNKVQSALDNTNVQALLMAIRHAEHDDRIAKDTTVYRALFGDRYDNRKLFSSFSGHPYLTGEWEGALLPAHYCLAIKDASGKQKYPDGKCRTTAAGAYQIIAPTAERIMERLGITDFSPHSQDLIAVELIREQGALELAECGCFEDSVSMINDVWASLPGSPYGQPQVTIADLKTVYQNYGGHLG